MRDVVELGRRHGAARAELVALPGLDEALDDDLLRREAGAPDGG